MNNEAWNIHKLKESNDFFGHIQNLWRPSKPSNPHLNLTFRFKPYVLQTHFNLPCENDQNIVADTIYSDQTRVIKNSLQRLQPEIIQLERNYKQGLRINKSRLDYLLNCRSQFRNQLERLIAARNSAKAIFSPYCVPSNGLNGNVITAYQKAEVDHSRNVLNYLREFYSKPS